MSRTRDVVFLERRVYRHRRMIDAAKMLPILACILFLFPALIIGDAPPSTAMRLVYFFFVWFSLIMVAATTARALRRAGEGEPASERTQPQEGARE